MILINSTYEPDDHVVDDEQEEIDAISPMFAYNKSKWNFVDHQEESHDHVDDDRYNEFHKDRDRQSKRWKYIIQDDFILFLNKPVD